MHSEQENSSQIRLPADKGRRSTPPVVLSIAGFDPSSGAGVTADVKTIAAHGCYGVTAITALTVQSTQGVRRVVPVDALTVADTLAALADDMPIAAVRVGMLGTAAVANAVATFLERLGCANVVVDPVIMSTSGAELIDSEGVRVIVERLLPLARVITPNVDEAEALLGHLTPHPIRTLDDMQAAAQALHRLGARGVVITGGHLEEAVDLLRELPAASELTEPAEQVFRAPKIASNATHGTGCAFATAVACQLALGQTLPEAVGLAKEFVRQAMLHAYPLGKGSGPLYHLYQRDERDQIDDGSE